MFPFCPPRSDGFARSPRHISNACFSWTDSGPASFGRTAMHPFCRFLSRVPLDAAVSSYAAQRKKSACTLARLCWNSLTDAILLADGARGNALPIISR